MNEKDYRKRLDFQQKIISKKSKEIELLELENEKLKQKLQEKDELISSVSAIREEMTESMREHKRLKTEYKALIQELKQMKKIINRDVYKNRWWLIKLIIK